MQGFYTLWAKDFIKNLNFVRELMANLQKALWQLSNVHKGNFQVLSQVWILILGLKPVDHKSNNSREVVLIDFIDNLLLSIEVDRAAHNDKRGIESVIVSIRVHGVQEPAGALNHQMVDALLLSLVVNAHVSKDPQRELANHSMVFI